ncbi:MAG: glucose-6-phosphate isomerase, partial [Oscillospiraceae bacterium]|nr:glucose-6-phosphate isomerase [Oscillospiraceae bacterium]
MAVKINSAFLKGFVREDELSNIAPLCEVAHKALHMGTGAGNDFLGWLNLPRDYDKDEFARIKAAAAKMRANSQV